MEDKERYIRSMLASARKRAKRKNFDVNIDKKYLFALWEKNEGKCVLTGIRFRNTDELFNARRPFIPSLDRIENNKGYVKGNVRIVCVAVNMALFTWGTDVFDKICKKRIEYINQNIATQEKQKIDELPSEGRKIESKSDYLMCRGHTENFFDLMPGWFHHREKIGLLTPKPAKIIIRGKSAPWYKYDKSYVKRWLDENPDGRHHPFYDKPFKT